MQVEITRLFLQFRINNIYSMGVIFFFIAS